MLTIYQSISQYIFKFQQLFLGFYLYNNNYLFVKICTSLVIIENPNLIFIFLQSMCSHEDAASDEMCKTVSTQIQTLVNANLNDSGYNFFKRFVNICSQEDNQGLGHCQNFAKGLRHYFVSR